MKSKVTKYGRAAAKKISARDLDDLEVAASDAEEAAEERLDVAVSKLGTIGEAGPSSPRTAKGLAKKIAAITARLRKIEASVAKLPKAKKRAARARKRYYHAETYAEPIYVVDEAYLSRLKGF